MRTLLALIASAGLVGCVGSVDPPIIDDGSGIPEQDNPAGNDLTPAKKLFDDNVYSILNAKCSGAGCHSETAQGATLTRFIATDAARGWEVATNYTALVGGYTTAAPILTLIDPNGSHQGMKYDQAETDKITAWLTKELELRNGQPSQPQTPGVETLSQAADRVMSQFAGCMTLENFQASNMAQAWANLQSNEGQCEQCHINGAEGFIANDNAGIMFPFMMKKMYFLQYLTVDLTQGAPAAKVMVNTVSFAGVYNNQAPHIAHPRFQHPNNAGMTALRNFYDRTQAAIAAGGCEPKPLQNL